MNRLLLLVLSIYCVYCTRDECNECTNQKLCNSIDVGNENLYCFKVEYFDPDGKSKCLAFPKEAEHQRLYYQLQNGFIKELSSCFVYLSNLLYGEDETFERIEADLIKVEKDFYSIDEVVKINQATLSSEDKDILASEKTCAFYFYGSYAKNLYRKYSNITDRKTCFNASKFNEFVNLIDCGYAKVKFNMNGEDYEITTCHFVPTSQLPETFNDIYGNYLVGEDI